MRKGSTLDYVLVAGLGLVLLVLVIVLFQVNNLGNEPYVEYYNNDLTQTKQYTKYGKTYLLGVNYKF